MQAVIHANLCMRLVELLCCKRDTVLVPALRTVGNIVTGTDEQTQAVLNCNALAALQAILAASTLHKKSIIKEACWTVSNITAGTREQIEAVIESGCIEPIVHLLKTGTLPHQQPAQSRIAACCSCHPQATRWRSSCPCKSGLLQSKHGERNKHSIALVPAGSEL